MDPWGAVIAVLIAVRDSDLALATFSAAGLVIPARADGAHIERIRSYVAAAQRTYEQLGAAEQQRVVLNMVLFLRNDLQRRQNAESLRQLEEILLNLGWRVIDDSLVQVTLVDPGELARVSQAARAELLRAAARVPHDPSGAITAACGAVDALTRGAYAAYNLGNHGDASFQEAVTRSLEAKGVWTNLAAELTAVGWEQNRVQQFVHNARGSINHAAFVMQTLRAHMGDAHGARATLDEMVFTSIKTAVVICVFLS
jgi:hypothetical protein